MNVKDDLHKDIICECVNNANIKDYNVNADYFAINEKLGEISECMNNVALAGPRSALVTRDKLEYL